MEWDGLSMAGNTNLINAAQMLQGAFKGLGDDLKQMSQGRALQRANEQIRQVRNSDLDDAQKMANVRQVADDLAVQMFQAGAGPQQIQQAFEQYVPKPQPIQTFEQGAAQAIARGDQGQADTFMKAHRQDQQDRLEIAREGNRTKIDVANINQSGKLGKAQSDLLGQFKTGKYAKAELDGLDALAAAPPENLKGNLPYVQRLRGLIKRTDTRISDEDFKAHAPNTSIANKAARAWSQLVNNQPLQEDDEAVNVMISALRDVTEKRVQVKARGFANVQAKRLKMDPEQVYDELMSLHALGVESRQPGQVPASNGGGQTLQPGIKRKVRK